VRRLQIQKKKDIEKSSTDNSQMPNDLIKIQKKLAPLGNNISLREAYKNKKYKYGIPKAADDSSIPKIPV
jgi:hypothetical protein